MSGDGKLLVGGRSSNAQGLTQLSCPGGASRSRHLSCSAWTMRRSFLSPDCSRRESSQDPNSRVCTKTQTDSSPCFLTL